MLSRLIRPNALSLSNGRVIGPIFQLSPCWDVLNVSAFFAGIPGFLVPGPEILPDKVHCGPTQASTSQCGGLPEKLSLATLAAGPERPLGSRASFQE
jgi:hypothetical protein